MTQELKVTQVRGGNRHPMSSRDFIITHLAMVGEDHPSSMHRAYKRALNQLAIERGRRYAYHKPHYQSFVIITNQLAREGIIELSGREDESDSPQFASWEEKPMRRYFRLVSPPAELPTLPISLDGARRDGHPKTTPSTNGKGV